MSRRALFFALLLSTIPASEQRAGLLPRISLGDSVDRVRQVLGDGCRDLAIDRLPAPKHPLAAGSETHLICHGLRDGAERTFTAASFIFGDEALVLVQVVGGQAVESLQRRAAGDSVQYGGFEIFADAGLVISVGQQSVWWLRPDDIHPHPFLWSDPALGRGASDAHPERSAGLPPELVFGASPAATRSRLEGQCATLVERRLPRPTLASAPDVQVQIDCFGLPYAGFPRKVEAVFGDGRLALVWILTGKAEEARVRAGLIEAYGDVVRSTPAYDHFAGGRVALRKDKPEVLFLSEEEARVHWP